MSVKWVEYKNVKILYIDFRLKSPKQMQMTLKEGFQWIENSTGKTRVLFDYRNAPLNSQFMEKASVYCEKFTHKKEKVAVLGIQGIKTILFEKQKEEMIEKISAFNTEIEAKNYLAI